MTAVTVVPATVAHLPWLRVLFARFNEEMPCTYPVIDEEQIDHFVQSVYIHLTRNPAFACFVALAGDEVVGFIGGEVTERAIGRPNHVVSVHWLYVSPPYRTQQVAHALATAFLAWAETTGCSHLEWFGMAGRDDWMRRGYTPSLTRYAVTIAQAKAITQEGASPSAFASMYQQPAEVRPVAATKAKKAAPRRRRPRVNGAAVETTP